MLLLEPGHTPYDLHFRVFGIPVRVHPMFWLVGAIVLSILPTLVKDSLGGDEMAVTVKLRRVLSALDDQQALDLVLTQLRKTRTNIEFLMQVAKNTPGSDD